MIALFSQNVPAYVYFIFPNTRSSRHQDRRRQAQSALGVPGNGLLVRPRELRDEVHGKIMADPRLRADKNPMPFDGKRMIFGGFEMIVER